MPLVQTQVPQAEYELLKRRAQAEGKTLKVVIREALRAHLLPDTVNPSDPIFHLFPLRRAQGKPHWASRDHDELLYPRKR